MTLHGKVQNGVVVFDSPVNLPEGTGVTVLVEPQEVVYEPRQEERMADEEYRRVKAIFDEIASLPNENPGDEFSGRDHDKALYGAP